MSNQFINEVWLPVVEWNGYYEVSNFGRVRSVARTLKDVTGHSIHYKGKVLSQAVTNLKKGKDYMYVMLKKDGKQYKRYVHVLVGQAFIENNENKPCLNHMDGNKQNNNLDNLEWSTFSENTQHAYDTGLIKSKVSNEDARFIYRAYTPWDKKFGAVALAEMFGVTPGTIRRIANGKCKAKATESLRKDA